MLFVLDKVVCAIIKKSFMISLNSSYTLFDVENQIK